MRPCSGIRVAGIPSFCTKRWVFSETLEKYTRLQDGTAISSWSYCAAAGYALSTAPASALIRSGRKPDQCSFPATTTGACRYPSAIT